jgi:DNA-binding NarL/FixJ family response regulator
MIRVALVDDHRVLRDALRSWIGSEGSFEVVADFGAAQEALAWLERYPERRPDVLVTDVRLPGINGLVLCRTVKRTYPDIRVLVLTMYDDDETLFGAMDAEADGILVKTATTQELAHAIRATAEGEAVLHPSITRRVIERARARRPGAPSPDDLTDREREILALMARGATSKEIGVHLGLSPKTVENHRARILEKLGVRNGMEAIALALQRGLIHAPGVV